MSTYPSGEQWTIRYGDQEAVVVEVGGGLRTYTAGGQDVLAGYPPDARCSAGRGQLLMPWPNRIRDGRYSFSGQNHQLALTEPDHANAIHGLVRWAIWSVSERSESAITVVSRLRAQPGWDWSLDLSVSYQLSEHGLSVTPRARNVGAGAAPFGVGGHPYLSVGEVRVDEVELRIPAASLLQMDDRQLPLSVIEVTAIDGTDQDFRMPRLLGEMALDTAFTDLVPDADGRWRVILTHPRTGRVASLWADAGAYPWLQVFTGDSLPLGSRRTSGIAVEPMTCPPDAFNSGDDLLVLEPGQDFVASWGITCR